MSTRCEILIKEKGTYEGKDWKKELRLYHHTDGYPEGVGKFLMKTVYPMLVTSHPCVDSIANYLVKNQKDDSFEVTSGIHPDIEYFYEVDINLKRIRCWRAKYMQVGRFTRYMQLKKWKEEYLPIEQPSHA